MNQLLVFISQKVTVDSPGLLAQPKITPQNMQDTKSGDPVARAQPVAPVHPDLPKSERFLYACLCTDPHVHSCPEADPHPPILGVLASRRRAERRIGADGRFARQLPMSSQIYQFWAPVDLTTATGVIGAQINSHGRPRLQRDRVQVVQEQLQSVTLARVVRAGSQRPAAR